MNEETARTRWCPMVRCNGIRVELDGAYDNSGNCEAAIGEEGLNRNPSYARCIASDCMMWIFEYEECTYDEKIKSEKDMINDGWEFIGFVDTECPIKGYRKKIGGHCGLIR